MPVDAIGAAQLAFNVAKGIYNQVQLLKENNIDFTTLEERLDLTVKTLAKLIRSDGALKFENSLLKLNETLSQIHIFFNDFIHRSKIEKFIYAKKYKDELKKFDKKLSNFIHHVSLDVTAEIFYNQEIKDQIQQKYYNTLIDEKDKLIGEFQNKYAEEHLMYLKQTDKNDELLNVRRSLELQIGSLVNNKPIISKSFEVPYYQINIKKRLLSKGAITLSEAHWNGQTVLVKKFSGLAENDIRDFKHEVKIMSRLNNVHIVQFYGACLEPDNYALLIEHMPNGSLYDAIENKLSLSHVLKQRMALEVAKGLNYIHSKKISHGSLSSINILIDDNWHVKLSDFGFSSAQLASLCSLRHPDISTVWLAPEVLISDEYDYAAADIYSYGMVLYTIFSGCQPDEATRNNIELALAEVPKEYVSLIKECLEQDPSKRIKLEKILQILNKPEQKIIEHEAEIYAHCERLIRENNTEALIKLSEFHRRGRGIIQKDKQKAYQYMDKAAQQGSAYAMLKVGNMWAKGKGVDKNIEEAETWYRKAKEAGDEKAEQKLNKLSF